MTIADKSQISDEQGVRVQSGRDRPKSGLDWCDTRALRRPRRSMRAAIDAFCRSCIYDPGSGCGTWRQQVEACPSGDCPLYPLRPRSTGLSREPTA